MLSFGKDPIRLVGEYLSVIFLLGGHEGIPDFDLVVKVTDFVGPFMLEQVGGMSIFLWVGGLLLGLGEGGSGGRLELILAVGAAFEAPPLEVIVAEAALGPEGAHPII